MSKIPTTILTGFLGAGKTTLLNALLQSGDHERTAVIVNEYGEVGIDGKLIVETQDTIVELNNGCICCTVRSDLISAITDLLHSGKAFDRILIETSGLADPAPVLQSFILEDTLKANLELDGIVTVVDAKHLSRQIMQDEAMEQIAFADVLILNKVDLVTPSDLVAVETELRRLNPLARIIQATYSDVKPSDVLDIGAFDLKTILTIDPDILEEHDHEHDRTIGCVAIIDERPLNPVAFNAWLARLVQAIGGDLFRMKGVLAFDGEIRRYVFHGVHMTLDGRPGRAWTPSERPKTELVFIGRNLDEAMLRDGFVRCLAAPQALAS